MVLQPKQHKHHVTGCWDLVNAAETQIMGFQNAVVRLAKQDAAAILS